MGKKIKREFNQQFATLRLREPIIEGRVMFTIDDEHVDQLFTNNFEADVDYIHDGPDVYYVTDQNDLEKFVDYIESKGLDGDAIQIQQYFKEESSVTGGESYAASLNAPSKKQNPFKEDTIKEDPCWSGYEQIGMKDKDGRQVPNCVPMKEGESQIEIDDRVKVVYGNEFYGETGTIVDIRRGFVVIEMDRDGEEYSMHISDVEKIEDDIDEDVLSGYEKQIGFKPGHTPDKGGFQYKDLWNVNEAYIPSNIEEFAKRKYVLPLVKKIANWAEKAGMGIRGGTAIGKNYNTLILDLTYQGGEIRIDCEYKTITVNGEDVDDYDSFVSAVEENETLQENYARFRNETKVRSGADQYHQAVKAVKKKVQEIAKLHTYLERMQMELSETQEGLKKKKYTEMAIQKIKEEVKQLNNKIKKLK